MFLRDLWVAFLMIFVNLFAAIGIDISAILP